ncbi:MAG: Beta-ketoadipyl-CoA thiolase, partial [Actinomycetota bacterium]
MSDDIWILGITMTKFGKHPDKDTVDLAAEAAMGALADGGVSMKEMGILAAGCLMQSNAGIGQQLQKQIGQTGIPVYNVANACATGATALRTAIMAVKSG